MFISKIKILKEDVWVDCEWDTTQNTPKTAHMTPAVTAELLG